MPDQFFFQDEGSPDPRPNRPISQGDVFGDVVIARPALKEDGSPTLEAKKTEVMVVSSSCDVYKGQKGSISPAVQVAPVSKMSEIGNGWKEPWTGNYKLLPLPGLGEDMLAADLSLFSLALGKTLQIANRIGCVTLEGARATKGRLMQYFTRYGMASEFLEAAAHEQWHEVTLWERWNNRGLDPLRFQEWLREPHSNDESRSRKQALYDDFGTLEEDVDAAFST